MKFLVLSIIAVTMLMLFACGEEEPEPPPPPLPAPTQPVPPTPDVQATVAAGVEATVVTANLQATAEAEAAPTNTPLPEPTPVPPTNTPAPPTSTPVPPTNTPVPEPTPVPPTNTPEPTETPEPPTSTPEPEPTEVQATNTPVPTATNTPRPTLTPTATPLPYGLTWDNPVPIGESFVLQNNEGINLRVREAMVFWGRDAWDKINREHNLNDRPPRTHEYLLINIQVKGHPDDANAYDAATRLSAEADPSVRTLYPNDGIYRWLGSNHCGGQVDTVIPRDFSLERYTGEDNGRRGFVCFIVTHNDSGKLVLVDNGGPGAPPEDRRYFSLR